LKIKPGKNLTTEFSNLAKKGNLEYGNPVNNVFHVFLDVLLLLDSIFTVLSTHIFEYSSILKSGRVATFESVRCIIESNTIMKDILRGSLWVRNIKGELL